MVGGAHPTGERPFHRPRPMSRLIFPNGANFAGDQSKTKPIFLPSPPGRGAGGEGPAHDRVSNPLVPTLRVGMPSPTLCVRPKSTPWVREGV